MNKKRNVILAVIAGFIGGGLGGWIINHLELNPILVGLAAGIIAIIVSWLITK